MQGKSLLEKMIDTLVGLDQMKDMFSSIQTGTEPSTEYEGTVKQIRTLLPEKEALIIQIKSTSGLRCKQDVPCWI